MNLQRPLADQKGMVIVIILLLLVLLSVLGITLMGISLTESNNGSNESGLKTALFAAEAGIQETMYRMHLDPNSLTDLESIKTSPANAPTSAFHGVVYVNGDYTQPPDGSTGVLIVHNATNTANLGNFNGGTFKGLIIADQVSINGTTQIIGGLATFASVATGEGNPAIKYSSCAVAGLAQNFPLHVVRGTWHEQ